MPSASGSEAQGGTAGRRRLDPFSVAVAIALTGGVAVFARAMLMEQPFGARIILLASVAGFGALLAALPLVLAAGFVAARWRPWLRATLAAIFVGGAFVPATLFVFAVENRIIEGHVDADSAFDLSIGDLFWTIFGAMGLFTPTGLAYLLPWPALAVALAAFLCFYRWPRPHA